METKEKEDGIVKVEGDMHVLEFEELNSILERFKAELGNDEEWKKLTMFYFQCKDEYKDLEISEITEKDYIYLVMGLVNPTNPAGLICGTMIAFKSEVLKLNDEDIMHVCNLLINEFPPKLQLFKEKLANEDAQKNEA